MGDRRGGRRNNDGGDEQFRKIFVGGLSYETTDETLRGYFEKWGEITDCIVMKDPNTKRSRGFGFVAFKEKDMVDKAQEARPHVIDGKEVDTKRAMPRADSDRAETHATVKKIFIGGIKAEMTEEMLRTYFSQFGAVAQVDIMQDKNTGSCRGFGFLTFEDYDAVDQAVLKQYHTVSGFKMETRKALSKQEMSQAEERMQGRQSRRGGGEGGGAGRGRDFDARGGYNQGGYGGGSQGGGYSQGGGGGGYSQGGGGGGYSQGGGGGGYSQGGGGGGYSQGGGGGGYNQGYTQQSYGAGGGGGGQGWGGNQGGGWGGQQQQQQQYSGGQSWGGQQQGGYAQQGGYNQAAGGPVGQDRSYSQRSSGPYGGGYGNQGGGGGSGGGGYRR